MVVAQRHAAGGTGGEAAELLASFGPEAKAAAPELRRWLRGSDPFMRLNALAPLAAMGDEEAHRLMTQGCR